MSEPGNNRRTKRTKDAQKAVENFSDVSYFVIQFTKDCTREKKNSHPFWLLPFCQKMGHIAYPKVS